MKSRKKFTYNPKSLHQELIHNAKVIGLEIGAAEIIADTVVKQVSKRVGLRAAITSEDLNRFVAEAAEKYNKDLAYFYQNRGKII